MSDCMLSNAASDGNLNLLRQCLIKNYDVNHQDIRGQTAFHLACECNQTKVIDLLLETSYNTTLTCQSGSNYGQFCHPSTATYLACIKFNKIDEFFTPIEVMVQNDDVFALDQLNRLDAKGYTPLIWSILYDKKNVFEQIMQTRGIDVNLAASSGHSPLMYAVYCNSEPYFVRRLLKRGANVNFVTEKGHSALFYAATWKNKEIVAILVRRGAKLELCHKWKSQIYDQKVYDFWLEVGVEVNFCDGDGNSALSHAASAGNLRKCQFLVQNGADVDSYEENGCPPLFWAIVSGQLEIVEFLIQLDASIDILDDFFDNNYLKYETNNLIIAIHSNNLKLLKLFVRNDCDLLQEDENGLSLLEHAIRYEKENSIEFFLQNVKTVTFEVILFHAIKLSNVKIVKFLLSKACKGFNDNLPAEKADGFLFMAVKQKSLEVVKALIEFGAQISEEVRNEMELFAAENDAFRDFYQTIK